MVADHLSSVFKQQFFVENRTGAGGAIGVQGVATSPPDGYNLVITNISMLVTIPVMNPKLAYHPTRDLTNIAYVAGAPVVVAVNGPSGIKSIDQLIALGKKQGKPLSYSSSGIGTNGHLLGESFGKLAKIDVVHIPYKGAAIGITDLIAGHINFGLPVLGSVAAHLRSGALVPLAHSAGSARARLSRDPDAEGGRLSRPDDHDLVLAVGAGEHAAAAGGAAQSRSRGHGQEAGHPGAHSARRHDHRVDVDRGIRQVHRGRDDALEAGDRGGRAGVEVSIC